MVFVRKKFALCAEDATKLQLEAIFLVEWWPSTILARLISAAATSVIFVLSMLSHECLQGDKMLSGQYLLMLFFMKEHLPFKLFDM